MKNKKLGIIGGMGPLATAVFMEKVIEMTEAKKDSDHIIIDVINDPTIPDRTEYLLGKSKENPAIRIKEFITELEKRGCDVIGIPCNTAFGLYEEFAKDSTSEIVHAIEETVIYLKENGIMCAGIMATDGTIQTGLFQKTLEKYGMKAVIPDEGMQSLVMEMIYDEVKCGKAISEDKMSLVSRHLQEQGAEVIVLGCTELSMAKRDGQINKGFLDTMDVCARKAVLLCGKTLKSDEKLF